MTPPPAEDDAFVWEWEAELSPEEEALCRRAAEREREFELMMRGKLEAVAALLRRTGEREAALRAQRENLAMLENLLQQKQAELAALGGDGGRPKNLSRKK
jgi:hypothetical protein